MRLLLLSSLLLFSVSSFSCSGDEFFLDNPEFESYVDTIKIIENYPINDSIIIKDNIKDVTIEKLFSYKSTAKTGNQGIAVFNDLMFQCYDSNYMIDVIDLYNKKKRCFFYVESNNLIHCNSVNFGPYYFDVNDGYPLLYIQQRGYANKLNVYRLESDQDSLFSASLVQTLYFAPCSYTLTSTNTFNNSLYVIHGYNKNNYLSVFNVPDPLSGDTTIDIYNAISISYLPVTKVIQDTASDEHYLYFLCGYGNEGELWQIDIGRKEAIVFDLTKYGLNGEPEGLECYEDGLLIAFPWGQVYKIKIK